ncbi:hypothetical protein ES288_D04G225700v1 [Gossypium darwinii]|uniref:PGG domain-containing protein n=1 Tax=Gossypium darwinii TaxID=34276 RepID=A0A5D2D1L7_GOSDA|nr:hypothetical protein ES288_D04G225700v1 [Gossypium darwinii]
MDQVNAVREMLRITDQESDTALHVAAQYGDVEMVEGLLELEDPDFPYSANKNQKTPLYLAAEIGNRGVLSVLLDKSKSTGQGGPTVEQLCMQQLWLKTQATKIILKKKGNLTKERDEDGHTPLHYAAHKCCSSVVEELLKWDASAAYVCDRKLGMTPLLMAARQAHLQKSQKIHSFCPDCCVKVDNRGWNLLHFLAFRVYPPRIAIYFFTLSRKMECASIRNLMDWKDALGITPHQVYDAYRPRIARARKSFENSGQKEKKKQIEELLKDIAREEVAECPVSPFSLPTVSAESLEKTRDAHLVVAGLIATITFAAAITIPGGLQTEKGSERGTPLLIDEAAFEAFVVTNAMAFILSVSALSIHFEIVNLLLSKLIFWRPDMIVSRTQSVSNLLGRAVIAMVIAFSTGSYVVLKPSHGLAIASCLIGPAFFLLFYY